MGVSKTSFEKINLKETTTPTAIADYGAVYTKTDNKIYFQDGAGNEHEVSKSDTYYAELYWNNNGNATVIETANTPIMVRQATTGVLQGWTFNAGSTGAVTAYADYSGTVAGTVLATSAGHGLATGDIVSIRGTTNYNGVFQVTVVSVDTFYFTDTWVDDNGASDWDEGSYLKAGTGAAGKYLIVHNASVTPGALNTVTCRTYKNSSPCPKCVGYRKFSNNDYGNLAGTGIADISDGDKIYMTLESTGTESITVKYGDFNLSRL